MRIKNHKWGWYSLAFLLLGLLILWHAHVTRGGFGFDGLDLFGLALIGIAVAPEKESEAKAPQSNPRTF